MMDPASSSILWPITTIDFEASALGSDSYPIEIGVARWQGPGTDIAVWSSLIAPTYNWRTRRKWDAQSAQMHHISRSSLDDAPGPTEVMQTLNRLCGLGTLAFCDGGDHDIRWMTTLADAAGVEPRLLLGSWSHFINQLTIDQRDRAVGHQAEEDVIHRAGADAVDHLRALAHALGEEEPDVVDWG